MIQIVINVYNNQLKPTAKTNSRNYLRKMQSIQKYEYFKRCMQQQNRAQLLEMLSSGDIQYLLKQEDPTGYTLLFWACTLLNENLALQIIPVMLDKGSDPYKTDLYQENVLYYITKHGKDRLLRYMFNRCVHFNANCVDQIRQTPIFFAASNGHIKCIQFLVQKGANVNHIDSNGQNCFFWASSLGQLETCKYLVSLGVNYQLVDFKKQTALTYAKKNKHSHVVAYLQDLRSSSKKITKDIIMRDKMESSQQQSKGGRKKKQLMRQPYCLIYTNQKGQVHQLTLEELQQFSARCQDNRRILDLIRNPEKLDSFPVPEQKKYEKTANKILTHFMKHDQGCIFLYPVDPVALNIPHYLTVIREPMDFTAIKTKLLYNAYDSELDFNADMNLVFDNCITFNGKESPYGKIATQMKLQFNAMYKKQFGI